MPQITLTKLNSVTRDTFIDKSNPNGASGSANQLVYIGLGSGSSVLYRGLVFFDLGLVPNDVIINSAKLRLYFNNPIGYKVDAHKVTSSWDNSTSWNTAPSFDPVPSGSVTPYKSIGAYYEIDVKTLVQEWVNGISQNYGFLIKLTNETTLNSNDAFHSFEGAYKPELVIDYTIPSAGKKCVEYVGSSPPIQASESITPTIPTGVQQGDLLLFHVSVPSDAYPVFPGGWTIVRNDVNGSNVRNVVALKIAGVSEKNPTVSLGSGRNIMGSITALRNAKQISAHVPSNTANGINVVFPAIQNINKNALAILFVSASSSIASMTFPLGYAETYDSSGSGQRVGSAYSYLHQNTQYTGASVALATNAYFYGAALIIEPIASNPPTITITSPADNQTLSEGNTLPVQGTAGDTDNGNVVTVKFKINGGTARAIASGVSDGSSPLSFARTLTYSNKRLWDGSTDVAGVDLAEGVDHTLTVWAEDDQGGKSAEITRKFRVIWNRPPTISGTDTDLGVISDPPSLTYSVSDPEGQSFTITEYLDGEVLRTFSGVAGQEYTVTIPTDKWLRTSLAQHTLKVRATDSAGQYSERIYTFTRTDDRIVFELDEPFLTDAKANRILVTLDAVIPSGASYIVEACNNAFDASPTWEDITGPVSAGRGYIFTNETKTAADWGVSIRFTFLKGTATEKILINGFGGAFD